MKIAKVLNLIILKIIKRHQLITQFKIHFKIQYKIHFKIHFKINFKNKSLRQFNKKIQISYQTTVTKNHFK